MSDPVPSKGIPLEWQRLSRPRQRLCTDCWRLASSTRCAACLATRETLASFRHCGCGRVDQEEVCSTCVGVPASYPRVLGARLAPHAGGLEVEAEGSRFSLAWSLLQPVPKPSLEPGLARAKWRFHCINLADQPADFCSGPENQWEVEWTPSQSSSARASWRTGHLDVRVSLLNGGTCQVQQMPAGCQLLCLGHRVHLCLEHRDQPLKAFRRRMLEEPEEHWPATGRAWRSAGQYVSAWRQLSFMEAASTAVAESEGRILDGVAIRFRQDEGTFEVPVDLMEAHQLRLRVDDLLCIRWPLPCRRRLLEEAFQTLASDGAVGRAGLRKLALFTGFNGDEEEWDLEYASLCRDLGADEQAGLDFKDFQKLVDDASEQGCFCSDEELKELRQLYGDRGGVAETWVAHAVVDSAEKFGDSLQVKFYICESPGLGMKLPAQLRCAEPVQGFIVELLSLPETYHYQASALADLPQSAPLLQDLILLGGVRGSPCETAARDPSRYQLNDSQSEAVRSALTSPVTLIHGPPGTGKTRTAAVVALAFASQNAQSSARGCVLYAANSNRAVDVAAEAIAELSTERLEDLFETQAQDEKCAICWQDGCNAITFCGHVFHRHCLTQALRTSLGGRNCPMCRSALKSIDGIRLLRVYSSDTENLEFPVPRPYRYEGVRERRRNAVPEEMRRFALHWRIHNKVPSHFNPRAAACEAAYDRLIALSPQSADFEAARSAYLEARREARAMEFQSCNILLATNCSCRRGWIPQMLQKENIELRQVIVDECGTSPEPESLCPLTLSRSMERIVLVGDHRQLRPVVKNRDAGTLGLACSLFERLSKKKLSNSKEEIGEERALLIYQAFQSLRNAEAEAVLGSEELRYFAMQTGWEGSDLEWAEEFQALCLEQGRDKGLDLAAFGRIVDDRSERGCYCSDEELRAIARRRPMLDSPADVGVLQAPSSVLLRQQYRMHPSMNSFPSKQFYDGKVFSDKSTRERPAGMLVHSFSGQSCPVLFWTSPASFREEVLEVATKDSSTRSKANVKEAERCARLAAEIAARAGAKSVAVLSWYNAQVVELKSWLRHLGARGVHCGSVVTAQGSEWDYVLLSTVLNSSLEVRLGCLADKHLLNVAVSRGRVGLVVLGRPEVLRTDRHWAAFLEHCEGLGGMLQDGDEPTLSGEPRAVAAKQEPLVQVPKQQFYPPLRAAQAPVGETQRLAEATRDFCRHLEERSDFRFQ